MVISKFKSVYALTLGKWAFIVGKSDEEKDEGGRIWGGVEIRETGLAPYMLQDTPRLRLLVSCMMEKGSEDIAYSLTLSDEEWAEWNYWVERNRSNDVMHPTKTAFESVLSARLKNVKDEREKDVS